MSDLSRVLPGFPVAQYERLLPTIERSQLTVTDLLTLSVPDIGKRTNLPLLDIKRFCDAILAALHADLGVTGPTNVGDEQNRRGLKGPEVRFSSGIKAGSLRQTGAELLAHPWRTISTLDASLDDALGGGVPTGYITEITGESGAGKTQFLLTLALSVQLPPPHGLGRRALYISTEAALSTKRLLQILAHNPFFRTLDADIAKPSLDGVRSTMTPDLESQDHILTYQLVRLGHLLRELARKHDLAVVVANQVADRFSDPHPLAHLSGSLSYAPAVNNSAARTPYRSISTRSTLMSQESPLASRSRNVETVQQQDAEPTSSTEDIIVRANVPRPPPEDYKPPAPAALSLDHQQRWFTGWGDDPYHRPNETLKTPSLGLVWSTQIASRIALFRRPAYGRKEVVGGADGDEYDDINTTPYIKSWRRWMKIVFAPHVPGTGPGLEGAIEFEVVAGGLKSVERGKNKRGKKSLGD
ncbi:DNA repair protein RAD57 [Xylaria sp. CBS 124048]|nr:DNA repair protein RAD57 [Xylaria sp. CBS 124048]